MIKKLCRISFLLLMIALFTLTGCSTSVVPMRVPEDQAMQTPTTEDNPFPEKLASLPSADFGAKAFRIATNSNTLIIPSGNTSIFDKALYQRNRAVEDKYNIRLTLTEESGLPTITSRIQREALAGSDYITVHVEAWEDVMATIYAIHDEGKKAGFHFLSFCISLTRVCNYEYLIEFKNRN